MNSKQLIADLLKTGFPVETLSSENKARHLETLESLSTLSKSDKAELEKIATEVLKICRSTISNETYMLAEFIEQWIQTLETNGHDYSVGIRECLYQGQPKTVDLYNDGVAFKTGDGCEKDPKKAALIFNKILELQTQQTVLRAFTLNELSKLYLDGVGVVRNRETAVLLMKEAADLGVTEAAFNAGLYFSGKLFKTAEHETNFNIAAKYYSKACGDGMLEAQTNLGILHLFSLVDDPDPKHGEKLLIDAYAAGDSEAGIALSLERRWPR